VGREGDIIRMDKKVTLQQLLDMNLHEYIYWNMYDMMVRVPGGWIYTVQKTPIFVQEPSDDAEFNEVEKIVEEEVKNGVRSKDQEVQKDESVCSESVHPDLGAVAFIKQLDDEGISTG